MSQPTTILIVDDEPIGRETLAALLHAQGYNLAFAAGGAEALAQAATLQPDLILLDVMMPEIDGFEVCRRLRADPAVAEVPIVLVTALDDRGARLEGIEAGADDFVTKPFDRTELRARIRAITRLNRYRHDISVRKQAEARGKRQIERLAAMRSIDAAIVSSLDLNVTLNVILDQVTALLQIDAATVLLRGAPGLDLEYVAVRGIRRDALAPNAECASYVAENRCMLWLPGASASAAPTEHALHRQGFVSYVGVPLVAKGRVAGVLEIFHRAELDRDQEWREFLETLAGQAAIAIDHAALFESMQRANLDLTLAYDTTLEGWARALELRDKETEGHSQRVTAMTLRLARALGMSEAELVHIRRGALLHDIGKMGVPDSILLKPGPLTEAEWEVMRKHPTYAYELLAPIAYLRPSLEIPYCHHERWDGTGYPHGLKGEQIPIAARIFALVDVWDALSCDRPYRVAWPQAQVRAHLRSLAGTHFDPRITEVFLESVLVEQTQPAYAVLVVDDHHDIAQAMSRSLSDIFNVFTANSGAEALEIIEREEIALIVTDQRMPDLTGVEVLERAKRIRPAALGLLCSAYFDREALADALNLGTVRGFIHKPWRLEDLRRRVGEVMQQYRTAARDSIEIGKP
ncbi:MAG TPA: response regulator [Roseiflexaceae bacterium]|nr:response regulator [Roseiflexaceae bacterium]